MFRMMYHLNLGSVWCVGTCWKSSHTNTNAQGPFWDSKDLQLKLPGKWSMIDETPPPLNQLGANKRCRLAGGGLGPQVVNWRSLHGLLPLPWPLDFSGNRKGGRRKTTGANRLMSSEKESGWWDAIVDMSEDLCGQRPTDQLDPPLQPK